MSLKNMDINYIEKSEIEKIQKSQLGGLENIPNRGLRLYPIQAVIIIGMMLTDSSIAEKLRSDINYVLDFLS